MRGRFSPVAGIQWVETQEYSPVPDYIKEGFSPVAGIQWVETTARNESNGHA